MTSDIYYIQRLIIRGKLIAVGEKKKNCYLLQTPVAASSSYSSSHIICVRGDVFSGKYI